MATVSSWMDAFTYLASHSSPAWSHAPHLERAVTDPVVLQVPSVGH